MPEMLIGNAVVPFALPAGEGAPVAAQEVRFDPNDGHMDWDGGWWVMMGMMFVFWIGVLVIAGWAVATYARRDEGGRQDSALDTARQRYARGEISAEEFEQIQRNLR